MSEGFEAWLDSSRAYNLSQLKLGVNYQEGKTTSRVKEKKKGARFWG